MDALAAGQVPPRRLRDSPGGDIRRHDREAQGMNSQQLAREVVETSLDAAQRITGIGAEQYSNGDTQKFETMPLDELFEYADEELLDLINYATMTRIRLKRLREVIQQYTTESGAMTSPLDEFVLRCPYWREDGKRRTRAVGARSAAHLSSGASARVAGGSSSRHTGRRSSRRIGTLSGRIWSRYDRTQRAAITG